MFVVASHQAETGRRKQKIAQLMGRVLAHGVNPEPPHPDEFDMTKLMEEKKRFLEERGVGEIKVGEQDANDGQIAEEHDDDNDEDAQDST